MQPTAGHLAHANHVDVRAGRQSMGRMVNPHHADLVFWGMERRAHLAHPRRWALRLMQRLLLPGLEHGRHRGDSRHRRLLVMRRLALLGLERRSQLAQARRRGLVVLQRQLTLLLEHCAHLAHLCHFHLVVLQREHATVNLARPSRVACATSEQTTLRVIHAARHLAGRSRRNNMHADRLHFRPVSVHIELHHVSGLQTDEVRIGTDSDEEVFAREEIRIDESPIALEFLYPSVASHPDEVVDDHGTGLIHYRLARLPGVHRAALAAIDPHFEDDAVPTSEGR
mmetsp:Transcript_110135/g.310522  ORF Transcript_110135/g.310522 Transcript_110135/m.310522 type:complete len:283 (-) Transcript_110135:1140-1988(-)